MIRVSALVLFALSALDRLAGSVLLSPLRPVAGGVAITVTPGGPVPVVTPVVGGVVDSIVGAQALGPDLSGVALVLVLAAALVGFSRGVRRELVSVIVIGICYFLFDRMWPAVTVYGNRLWQLVRFAVFEKGAVTEDTAAAWQAARAAEPLLPVAGGSNLWQIGLFVIAILVVGYGGGKVFAGPQAVRSFSAIPKILERIVGAVLGGAGGNMISHFVLPRIVPNAQISLTGPRSVINERIGDYGPTVFLAIIIVLILYGVSGIGGSGPKTKVYS